MDTGLSEATSSISMPPGVASSAWIACAVAVAGSVGIGAVGLRARLPDGVSAVTISTERGLPRTVAVRSNLYATQIFAPKTISFTPALRMASRITSVPWTFTDS